jgi:hypothetical protein
MLCFAFDLLPQMHEAHKLAPSKDTLQALRNARQLISRCSATLPYKSPLPRRQVGWPSEPDDAILSSCLI